MIFEPIGECVRRIGFEDYGVETGHLLFFQHMDRRSGRHVRRCSRGTAAADVSLRPRNLLNLRFSEFGEIGKSVIAGFFQFRFGGRRHDEAEIGCVALERCFANEMFGRIGRVPQDDDSLISVDHRFARRRSGAARDNQRRERQRCGGNNQ